MILENDSDILTELKSGNKNLAINSFVRKYQTFVYATSYRFLNDYDDADDASQEIFIKAINALNRFQNKSSLKSWLYKISVNHCKNLILRNKFKNIFRLSKADDNFDLIGNAPNPEQIFLGNELNDRINLAINSLPEKQRETFILRHFEEMSYDEISNILGTTTGGLKANYHQAIKKISKIIENKSI